MRLYVVFFLLLLGAAQLGAQGIPARAIVPGDVPNEYIVSLQGVPREQVDAVAREIAAKVDGRLLAVWKHAVTAFWIRVPSERASAMHRDPRVRLVEQNARIVVSAVQPTGVVSGVLNPTPAGEYPPSFQPHPLWHLARISHRTRGSLYYHYQNGGTGVRAYTLDGGALRFHQEFVTEGTPAAGSHLSVAESPRVIEEAGSNAIHETGGDDHLPSTAPHQDCNAGAHYSATIGGLRYASEYPWFLPTGKVLRYDHGTGVNSALGGRNVGVAKDVLLVPVKTLGCGDTGTIAAAIHGADWILKTEQAYRAALAADATPRAAVVSISTYRGLGSEAADAWSDLTVYETAIDKLVESGIPVFASANNGLEDACNGTPNRLSRRGGRGRVITVGGLAKSGDRQWIDPEYDPKDPQSIKNGSNVGPCIDIIAPAEEIPVAYSASWSAYRPPTSQSGYQFASGTSYSAPIVAGIAARMLAEDEELRKKLKSVRPADVADEIWRRLLASATVLPEKDGADGNAPLGENSPNRIAYMGAVGFVTQPQSHDFAAGESVRTLTVTVAPGAAVAGYDWYAADDPQYDAAATLVQSVNTTSTSSTFNAPRPTTPARKWYWVRVRTPQPQEFAESAMAALSVGCAVITRQPSSTWIGSSGTATLSVQLQTAVQPTVTWYRGIRGNVAESAVVGTGTSLTLTFTTVSAGGEYWARISTPAPNGCVVDSDVAQVRKCPVPEFGADPDPNKARTLKREPNGTGWRVSFASPELLPAFTTAHLYVDDGGVWRLVQSNFRNTSTFNMVEVAVSRSYKIVLDNQCGSAESTPIVLDPRCEPDLNVLPKLALSATVVHANTRVTVTQLLPQASYTLVVKREYCEPNTLCEFTSTARVFNDEPTTHTTYTAQMTLCGKVQQHTVSVTVAPRITKQPPATVSLVYGSAGVVVEADGVDRAGLPVRYQWYDADTRLAIGDAMPGAQTNRLTATRAGRYFLRVTSSRSSAAYTDTTVATVVLTCSKPRRRAVRSSSTGTAPETTPLPPGAAVTLSVEDDYDGTTFAWFEGADYLDTAKPVGTTATVVVAPLKTTSYWAKMTRTCGTLTESETSPFFTVTVQCTPVIYEQPKSSTALMTAPTSTNPTPVNQTTVSVTAGGEGATYQWFELRPDGSWAAILNATASSYTWSYAVPNPQPAIAEKQVRVEVTACVTGKVTSDVATLTFVKVTPQRVFSYNDYTSLYRPTDQARLFVTMDPPATAGVHAYTYEWYEHDGTPSGKKLTGTTSEKLVTTPGISRFWCRITGTHTVSGVTYTEVTVSPTMYVTRYGVCELPDMTISQSHQSVPAGSNSPVTFTAVLDWWPNPKFQWYKGQTGDTRDPMASDPGKPNQLTVSSSAARSYWVRATLECGAYEDSPTLTFTVAACKPVLIEPNLRSVDVAYGASTEIAVTPINVARPRYSWYEGPGMTTVASAVSAPVLSLTNIVRSGRYWVRVQNLDCYNNSDSYLATVRVASCPSLTPPAWKTEVWTDINSSTTLAATTAGATGYQWYAGEVGDTTQPIGGATLSTYTTPVLTTATKYWVRVTGTNCLVDSPTITVKICEPPRLLKTPFLTQSVPSGQRVTFSIDMAGTDLAYQWYKGFSGDTSTPVGQPVNLYEFYPTATSEYWVRVTSRCGTGGTDARVYNSATYLASVCPVAQTPTAAKTAVMPNTTTTLSISATGSRLTYQWYKGAARDNTNPIPNSNASTITTPPITGTTSFWCEVKSGNCSAWSEVVTVGLCSEPTVRWVTGDKAIMKGEAVTFTATATHSTATPLYTFYKGNAGDVAGSVVVKGETEYYWFTSVINETGKYWVRARVDNCYADSANITITVCIPQITTQPAGGGITLGGSHTMSVVSDITPVNGYQWYIGESGDVTKPITGATAASLTVSPTADTKYWVRVKGCGSSKADSTAALVTVCVKPAVTNATASQWITKGETKSLFVSGSGTNLTYAWYRGATGVTTTRIATTDIVSVSPADTTQYWARISNGCGTADTATITINVCAPPAITTQPASQPIFSGKTATLTVAATQATSTPMTYQWYSGAPGSGTAISGATSSTYTTGPLTAEASYYVRITAGTCSTDSNVAVISMCAYNEVINAPSDKDIAIGQTVRLQVSPISPAPDQVRWYRGAQGDKSTLVSSYTYADVAPTVTTQYWGEFVQGGCTSKTRTVTVFASIPTITTHPANTLTGANTSATLSVVANTTGLTYQWYQGTSGSGTAIAGATAASYTTPALAAGSTASYWVKVTGSRGHAVNSNTAVVTWCNPAVITRQPPATVNISRGSGVWLSVNATGTNLRYEWFRGATGVETYPGGSGSISNSGGTSSLWVSPSSPEKYWVKVTSDCGSVSSITSNVDVCVTPIIDTHPAGTAAFSGGSATLSVAARSGNSLPLSYQWYNATTHSPISGATSATFTTPPLTQETSYYVEVKSGVCSKTSEPATVTMCALPATINSPGDRDTYSGQSTTLSISVYPAPESYVWYSGVSGDRTSPMSYSSQVTVAPTVTSQFWGEFTHGGCTSIGRTVTVRVCIPRITTQPASKTITRNTTTTLSVVAKDATSYQWYVGTTSGYGTAISGATSSTYTTPALGTTTSYWVRVNGSCNRPMDSNVATVTVN